MVIDDDYTYDFRTIFDAEILVESIPAGTILGMPYFRCAYTLFLCSPTF